MTPSSSPQLQATIAGRYTVLRKLGSGSLGTVYLVQDEQAARPAALKLLRTDRFSAEAVQRFQREFGTLASLQHPRIAAAYDFGYSGGRNLPFYTREYVEGTSLPAGPPDSLDPPGFLKPILDLLEALDYLHRHGILHLDIHAGNLILAGDTSRGSVLIDFGLFRSRAPLEPTAPARFPVPLPPDIAGRDPVSPATDVFLAGRLLLYRLCGEACSEAQLPREIPGWGTRLTLDLERIAAKAIVADPARRFPSAAEFHQALSRALGNAGGPARPQAPFASIIGRDVELARIEGALERAAAGQSEVLCLKAPSGLGKTRLLGQARLRAQLLGLGTAEVRFYPDVGPSCALAGALSGEGAPGRKRGGPRWVEALDAAHGGTPEERAQRAARRYFDEEGKAMALLLDDLDQADRSSRVLAKALLDEAASCRRREETGRGLCIIASTSSTIPPGVRRQQVLTLRPLRPPDARRLLRALVQPLAVPDELVARATARSGGSPLRLRQVAQILTAEWGRAGAIPPGTDLPDLPSDPIAAGLAALSGVQGTGRAILDALSVLAQPASCAGIAYVLDLEPSSVHAQLRNLGAGELVLALGHGPLRRYQLSRPASSGLPEQAGGEPARRLHRRMARFLEARPRLSLRDEESLARHLLLSGRKEAGLRRATRAASVLRRAGHHERAVTLLAAALEHLRDVKRRFAVLEELSAMLAEIGDHERGLSHLEPFAREAMPHLPEAKAIRLRRRLGVHFNRCGRVNDAVRTFEEALRLADPGRDREELVCIEAELAELHTLRGRLDSAEAACQQGMARLENVRPGDPFRARMEVVLRASRGHLELRRLRLDEARTEFRSALRLSRRFRMPAVQAVILNNLGITENQLGHVPQARRVLREAERLFLAAGEKRSVILIACNLAVIAAKLGQRDEARLETERVERLLRTSPGERLEFYAGYTRGIAACLLGDVEQAIGCLEAALPRGRRLGDLHHVRFGEVVLREAQLACGRYAEAWRGLRALSREAKEQGPPILLRMAHSRTLLLSVLLGRPLAAEAARQALELVPRGGMHLLEAWNELAIGVSCLLSGDPCRTVLEGAQRDFHRFAVDSGERFAALALLWEAVSHGDRQEVERGVNGLDAATPEGHRFLAVARPLVLAEAHAFLGNPDQAMEKLSEASGAIIGSPFLELDWRIEFLRARLALKAGDTREARARLHRALHTRDLLQSLLPVRARERFLTHPRFRELEALRERLDRSPRLLHSTPRSGGEPYQGMVGSSGGMLQVFQTIDRLRDQEVQVFITGETGTGKELVARALHRTGPRSGGPFFALHAGSLPLELFESELFGHEKGAFTGAEAAKAGILETLAGGTLLLDGVNDLPLAAQAKLLRVLDSGRARRLGASLERPVDVRILSSAAENLRERVEAGTFRADLLYRLGSVEIHLPPLRERREDIPLLSRHFLELHARRLDRTVPRLEPNALEVLERGLWPGNVRELETVLFRAMVTLAPHASLGAEHLKPLLEPDAGTDPEAAGRFFKDLLARDPPLETMKWELERFYLLRLFGRLGGDLWRMMEILKWKRSYLYCRMKEVGIDIQELRKTLPQRRRRRRPGPRSGGDPRP